MTSQIDIDCRHYYGDRQHLNNINFMKIAILGAMREEIEPFLEYFEIQKEEKLAGNSFYLSSYKGVELIICYSKIGKVFSTLIATILIERFAITHLLFSGVAGAISKDLKIGDLFVANKLCQHDIDITGFGHPLGFIPESKIFYEADKNLLELALFSAAKLDLSLKEGVIATGDQFVNSNQRKQFIIDNFSGEALDMEGASVAVVCSEYKIPFLIIRAISDEADDEAGQDFDEFLVSSSKKTKKLIVKIVQKLIEEEK